MKKTSAKKIVLAPLAIGVTMVLCMSQFVVPNLKHAVPKSVDFVCVRDSFKNDHSYRVVWTRPGREGGIGSCTFTHEGGILIYGSQSPLPDKN